MLSELRNVSKTYRHYNHVRTVLDNVNFEIKEGDFLILSGDSGSGKSTLLALIGGFLKPDSGSVMLMEKDISVMKEKTLAYIHEYSVGYVPQSNVMLPELTVSENITLPFYFKNRDKQSDDYMKELLELFGLGGMGERFPFELSGGELRRIALIRALLDKPKLMIVDEPTAGLDADTAEKIMKYLCKLCNEEGMAVLVSTHDMSLAEYGKCRIRIEEGNIKYMC